MLATRLSLIRALIAFGDQVECSQYAKAYPYQNAVEQCCLLDMELRVSATLALSGTVPKLRYMIQGYEPPNGKGACNFIL